MPGGLAVVSIDAACRRPFIVQPGPSAHVSFPASTPPLLPSTHTLIKPLHTAARDMMWVLQDIPEMNALGVERMIRGLALLQVRELCLCCAGLFAVCDVLLCALGCWL